MYCSALLLFPLTLTAGAPDGAATIRAAAGGSEIVITTTSRLAGAIHSLRWDGQEFIDSYDHGRQLQSASNLDCGKRLLAETFNPTEAGARADGTGPRSTSRLLAITAKGNELSTRTQMAFWLRPGEKSDGHPAYNTVLLSDHVVAKRVRIGYRDMPQVLDYHVTFTLPRGERHTRAVFEALTGYMPPGFSDFRRFDPASGKLVPLSDGPGEQPHPVVLSTPDGRHAMGIYSPERPGPGYGRWRFRAEKVVKWNCVFRASDKGGLRPGDYAFQMYVVVGTRRTCEETLGKLHRLFADAKPRPPNVVCILADDLGYGDVKCLNPAGKIATPNLDKLASQGMAFTDAHSGSSVCTPTRYGILTGRYAWRSRLKRGVLGGYSPRLIEEGRLTVPALLKKHGYHTACVGKWHLGMDFPLKGGGTAKDYPDAWKVDYARPIANGPLSVGFDTYFGISASLDMPPYLYIEDDRFRGVPTVEKTWVRTGPAHQEFEAADVLPSLTEKATAYVRDRAKAGGPFFLYLALNSPHTPILPTSPWKGKSGLNAYADFVMQTDDAVGRVLRALDEAGVAGDTLVVFSSDNGCSPQANFAELQAKGHRPSYRFRGHKADIYDGGHRVPFLVRWPDRVKAGTTSGQLVCLTDLLATCAQVVGARLPADAGEDSLSLLPALTGARGPRREAVVHHSVDGSFAIRQGEWKLCLCPGSGGWSKPRPGKEDKGLPPVQLYDMERDPGEASNLQAKHPEVVERLTKLLQRYGDEGRSTPAPR